MTLDLDHPPLAPLLDRLHPRLRSLCAAAGKRALAMHSDEVTLAHLLEACMRDEECAAHALAEHVFADPETVAMELAALCPGLLVVGARAVLPFSTRAAQALHAARARAVDAGAHQVGAELLLAELGARLDPPLDFQPTVSPTGDGPGTLSARDPLFRGFSSASKQALVLANREAFAAGEPSISPARLVTALLTCDPELPPRVGLRAAQARARLAGATIDPTPPPARILEPSPQLETLLAQLPAGGGSLDLFEEAHARGGAPIQALLERHKLTPARIERARGGTEDALP